MLPIVCEEDDSTSSSSPVVHFSPILITSIHNRPTTDEDDIPTLYYTARDINQFKYEYRLFVSACQRFQNWREDRKQMAAAMYGIEKVKIEDNTSEGDSSSDCIATIDIESLVQQQRKIPKAA
jgi:hypothetical protein